MATVSLKPGPVDTPHTAEHRRKRSTPRRGRKGLLVTLVAILVLALSAPSLIAISSLRDLPLRMVFDGIDGSIRSGGASLGWFSTVEYRDVEIYDRDEALLARVPSVTVDRTVLNLLLDRSRLGKVTLEQPELSVVTRTSGSNAEDVLLPWWNAPSSGPIEMELAVVDATIKLKDAHTGQEWTIASLAASLQLSLEDTVPVSWSASGKIDDGGRVGEFNATSTADETGAVGLKAEQVPLAIFGWLARRASGDLNLAGELACDLVWQSASAADNVRQAFRGQLGLIKLAVSGGPLQGDTLALADLLVACDVQIDGDRVRVNELKADCELGRITASGAFAAAVPSDRRTLAALAHEKFALDGSLDLARLSQMLPRTLRIRPGTQISEGTVRVRLASDPAAGEHNWQALLESSGLAATNAGKSVSLEKPIKIELAARETKAGLAVDALECSADFLQITGKGTPDNLTANLQFDLNQLRSNLGQLFDLGDMRLAGDGRAQLHWQRGENGDFRATAAAQLKNFALGTGAASAWREADLTAELQAAGRATSMAPDRLDTATLRVMSAGAGGASDQLEIQLREPVATPRGDAGALDRLPILVRLSGDLSQWRTRAAPWVELRGWKVAGSVDAHANATWSPTVCEVHSLQAALQQLQATDGRWFIEEPLVKIAAAGRYHAQSGTIELSKTAVESSAASFNADKLSIMLPAAGSPGLRGQVAFTGDLARLQRWTQPPNQPAAIAWSGQLRGRADLAADGDGTSLQFDANIANLAAAAPQSAHGIDPGNPLRGAAPGASANRGALWQEKQLALACTAAYLAADDTMRLETLQIASEALKVQASGEIQALSGKADLNLQGHAEYDWSQLSRLLAPYFGKDIRVEGRETSKFAVRGPIRALLDGTTQTPAAAAVGQRADPFAWTRPLTAQASAGWQRAEAFGLAIGKGAIVADLRDGLVKTNPIELAVSEGRVRLSPQVLLTPAPAEFVHGQAKVIERVRVTPQMTASWLKFIAPAVAEATQTQGELSLELTGLKVPLFNPETASAVGRLEVHTLEVTPGPPARAVILLAEQIRALVERRPPPAELSRNPTLLRISDQAIDFRMAGGRVVHQGMTMNIGDVTVRTSGWVALDETIGLVAEIPIQEQWIQRMPALANMKGQSLQVPIGGTLRRPQIDSRAWQQILALFAQSAARGVIEDQLNKQLDRLFER